MKKSLKLIAVVLFFVFALYSTGDAQDTANAKNSARLVLQVKPYPDTRPEYYSIPGSRPFIFRKTAEWNSLNESMRATTVHLAYTIENDAIKIDLTVSHGQFHDRFSPAITYLAYEQQPLILNDLLRFGIEPFEITVVRLSPESAVSVPRVTSKAPSIDVVGVAVSDPVSQSYVVSLRNNSKKNLYELEVQSFRKNAKAGIMWPTGERGRWLAGPGEVFKARITSFGYGTLTNDGYVPDSMTSAVVMDALFDDGTVEGDTKVAAGRVAVTRGRNTQLSRIIRLFQNASAQSDADVSDALSKLMSQVEALTGKLDDGNAKALTSEYPDLFKDNMSELVLGFEGGATSFKRTVLADIVKFKTEHGQSSSTATFNQWLTVTREEYERWLATMK